jgi:hypothetical protein
LPDDKTYFGTRPRSKDNYFGHQYLAISAIRVRVAVVAPQKHNLSAQIGMQSRSMSEIDF